MNKVIRCIVAVILLCLVATGCDSKSPVPDGQGVPSQNTPNISSSAEIVHEGESVQIIRAIMELDYNSMTVEEFNKTIQKMCSDAGTNIFEVISDAYDHFGVYNDSGEFVDTVFPDSELEHFMQTTLEYSSQEIFGEPVHLGSIMYMTTPDMSAKDLRQKKAQMSHDEWNNYFEENISEITVFPILSYSIEAGIANPDSLLVADRDGRINDTHTAIINFFTELDKETSMQENLWNIIELEFERISSQESDAKISISCMIQELERDMP